MANNFSPWTAYDPSKLLASGFQGTGRNDLFFNPTANIWARQQMKQQGATPDDAGSEVLGGTEFYQGNPFLDSGAVNPAASLLYPMDRTSGSGPTAWSDPTFGNFTTWQQAHEREGIGQDPSTFSLLKPSLMLGGLALGANALAGGLGATAGGAGAAGAGEVAAGGLPAAGGAGAVNLGAGATGLTEGALASEAGFVPGSFELGTAGAGGAAATGIGGATGAAGGGLFSGGLSAINNALGTNLTGSDAARIGAGIGQGVLGYLGAGQQADAYKDVAAQQAAIGAPYRDLLTQSYGPNFDLMKQPGYGDAFNRIADISSRSYSARMGNPADNPSAQAGILNDVWQQGYLPALANYRGGLGQFAGLGLNTSGAAALAGAGQTGGQMDAIGYGLGTALGGNSLTDQYLQQLMRGQGGQNLALTIGGNKYGG